MGHKLSVIPANIQFEVDELETVLDAALKAGVHLPHGCKGGNCGSCICKVVEGEVNHVDEILPSSITSEEFANGYRLLCQSYASSDAVLELNGFTNQLPIKTLPTKLLSVDKIGTTAVVKLKLPSNQSLVFYPGQYIDILYKDQARSYSLANIMNKDNILELHIRYHPHGLFSEALFNEIELGSIIRFKGPMGSFTLNETSDKDLIFICTGTGFAPIKSILDSMVETKNKRKARLIWGNLNVEDFYLTEILAVYQAILNLDVTLCISESSAKGFTTGFVTDILVKDYKDLSHYQLYACGNPKMIESAYDIAKHQLNLSDADFFSDSFTPSKNKENK